MRRWLFEYGVGAVVQFRGRLQTTDQLRLEFGLVAVNSISISVMLTPSHLAGQKVKPRWPPMEGNFVRQFQSTSRSCTSIPILCTTLVFNFCLVRLQKHSQWWKMCSYEILVGQFYIVEHLKGFFVAVWPKKCAELSKGGKLTVTRGRAFSSSFLK